MPLPMRTAALLGFFMTAGQVSDYTGAAALLDDMPKAQWLLGDRGYTAPGDVSRRGDLLKSPHVKVAKQRRHRRCRWRHI